MRKARRRNRSTLSHTKQPTIDSYLPQVTSPNSKDTIPFEVVIASEAGIASLHRTSSESLDSKDEAGGNENSFYGQRKAFNAIKIIHKDLFFKRVTQAKERADAVVREVLAQVLLSQGSVLSPNNFGTENNEAYFPIVRLFSIFETFDAFVLELELMKSMDLFDQLSQEGVFSENKVRQVAQQLTLAAQLFTDVGIAHRDIKLSNITFPKEEQYSTADDKIYVKVAGDISYLKAFTNTKSFGRFWNGRLQRRG